MNADPDPLIPVFRDRYAKGWPKHPDSPGDAAHYGRLSEAMTHSFDCDAHFSAYSYPALARRLTSAALAKLPQPVCMVCKIFDVDDPSREKGGVADALWRNAQLVLLASLLEAHGGHVYNTRGGYRVVYIRKPFEISDWRSAQAWSQLYRSDIHYLKEAFGIRADPACCDWTRIYRLPNVVRGD